MCPFSRVPTVAILFLAFLASACRPANPPPSATAGSGVETGAVQGASVVLQTAAAEGSTDTELTTGDGSTAALPTSADEPGVADSGWRTVNPDDVPDEVRQTSQSARQALGAQLLTTLQGAIAEHGHVGAVDVCHTQAPGIAEAVSAERGLRVGRTSLRQRNPENAPPAWAAAAVQGGVMQPVWWQGPAGEWGELTPILTAAPCTSCHGTPEALAPGVAEAIASRYPDDRATGFEEGSLRGYFWVEVPGTASAVPNAENPR